ncbi:hypothetical protein QTP88_022838 [Uroleucon formosanum]
MRVCCLRVFVDSELWDCLLIVKSNRKYVLYTTVNQLPFSVSAELCSLGLNGAREPMPTVMDANCLECVIKALANSNTLKRSVVRRMNSVASVDNNNIVVGFNDVRLVTPDKYRLPYTWCELYEKTDTEYRELENIMAWLSTLGGAFSSLGDQTEHCAIVAGNISLQQLRIAMRIGDPLTAARCKLYAAISLMQRGFHKQAKLIVQSQYIFIKSQLVVDERLIKMCCGVWTKLRYEWNRKKCLKKNSTL